MLLHVITVPRQTPLEVGRQYIREAYSEVVDQATAAVEAQGIRSSSIIRIAHKPAEAIIHEVEDRDIDMVVLGWRGRRRHPRTAIGSNIDLVLRHADCHVAVLRADRLDTIRSILIPITEPRQAHLMVEVGEAFERHRGARIELYHAVPPDLDDAARNARTAELYTGLEDLGVTPEEPATRSIRIEATSYPVSRIAEMSADYDLVILGAAREGWVRKLIAGTRQEHLVRRIRGPLVLVKHRRSLVRSWILDTVEFFRRTAPEGSEVDEP